MPQNEPGVHVYMRIAEELANETGIPVHEQTVARAERLYREGKPIVTGVEQKCIVKLREYGVIS